MPLFVHLLVLRSFIKNGIVLIICLAVAFGYYVFISSVGSDLSGYPEFSLANIDFGETFILAFAGLCSILVLSLVRSIFRHLNVPVTLKSASITLKHEVEQILKIAQFLNGYEPGKSGQAEKIKELAEEMSKN